MKIKFYLLSVLCALMFSACDDTLNQIGSSIRPDGDDLLPKSAIFEINTSTFLFDSVYLRTPYPLLGQIEDDFYKTTITSDYAAQFYVSPNFSLDITNSSDSLDFTLGKDSLLNNQLDSAKIRIFYSTYYGDSLSPMVVTAYELTKKLPRNFYSNMNFEGYYDPSNSVGTAAYTGLDEAIADSIKEESDYVPYIDMFLDDSFKDKFYDAIVNDPEIFKDEAKFEEFFPGIYFKNTYGTGTLLRVEYTTIGLFYTTVHTVESSTGADSIVYKERTQSLSVTPDVIQLNSLRNVTPNSDILNNDTATFIISPGSYFTEMKLPIGAIMDTLHYNKNATAQYLNGFNFNLQAYKPTEFFTQYQPQYLLMVERSKMNEFFENNSLPDNQTSFVSAFSQDTINGVYKYNFGNINTLVLNIADSLQTAKGSIDITDTINIAIVPVSIRTSSSTGSVLQISNYFLPGGVALWGGEKKQKATMIFTEKVNE